MAAGSSAKVQHLVVDAAAFIKNERLECHAAHIHTVQPVLDEIRHPATRQRLAALPYELHVASVEPHSLAVATTAAKSTGDYGALSPADLHVIALAYQLTRLHDADRRLVLEPTVVKSEVPAFRTAQRQPTTVSDGREDSVPQTERSQTDSQAEVDRAGSGDASSESDGSEESDSESQQEEEDDGDEWITGDNLHRLVEPHLPGGADGGDADDSPPVVACITSDFAIQNVLLHMRLCVMSLDGLIVRHLRSYVMRCRACFKTTSKSVSRFCAMCGHESLHRVPVTVTADGRTRVYVSRRRLLNTRGLKHALAAPAGGKHPAAPIRVTEDHALAMNRPSRKAVAKMSPMHPDYLAMESPFSQHDTNSKSAMLGVRSHGGNAATRRANPNAYAKGKKRGGKRR